ncbi:MAG: molecular chaperone DnaK [Clostridia bacterium]|nr:molecular chaperone DnaK [Clostridia bacterium]
MAKIVGIDLGTTNSCMAFMENGGAVIIPNAEGGRTTPSVVSFTGSGERVVGGAALRQAITNPEKTITSIKRKMGAEERVMVDGKRYSPQEISAFILQKLKADAEAYLGEQVTGAVITVPAYFSDAQRQATKDAGRIAGLDVKRIINEPTAAALAYGLDKNISQKIMVYDLGGGTFDVSILDITRDIIEVLSTAGNNHLGGDDFDACVTEHLVKVFKETHHTDPRHDPSAMQRVKEAAVKAKMELSGLTTTQVQLPFLVGNMHLETTLTRSAFEQMTEHLVKATTGPMRQAMQDAGLTPKDLDKVLLVGGSTRIPAVARVVREYTGMEPAKSVNPDECVAIGAALQGGVLLGQLTGLLLVDVTPLSLGIETVGDVFSPIITRNTPIPVHQSQVFTTAAPFQSTVEINVLQGEREIASANKSLGKFKLKGIRRAMQGVPQIQVTFSIDSNGIVSVSAKDLDTNKQQEITIAGSSNLSQSEIDRAIRDAQAYAKEDAYKKDMTAEENRSEQLLYQSQAVLKQCKKSGDPHGVQAAVNEVQHMRKRKDIVAMKAANDALSDALQQSGYAYTPEENSGDGAADAEILDKDTDGRQGPEGQ